MPDIDFIRARWPAPNNIKAISTTRFGGRSAGVYDSFNLGAHVGDSLPAVTENRRILLNELGLERAPIWLEQVHGSEVVDLDELSLEQTAAPVADAAITRQSQQACAIMTADCLPILFTNTAGDQVAAVHAGWRGLADGVIEETVNKFDASPDNIMAWCGPCIGPNAFEIGAELIAKIGGPDHAYRPHQDSSKVYANLQALAKNRLEALGVDQCYTSAHCTYSEENRFFSYRRDGQTGRMASLIWIQD